MSLVRIHNFSISLDGFGTGEGQSREAPFGHAGERLHEWMFSTRFWHPGGSGGSMTLSPSSMARCPGTELPAREVSGLRLWERENSATPDGIRIPIGRAVGS